MKLTHCFERQKTYIRTCAPSKDLDQLVHLCNLIRIFTRRILDIQLRIFIFFMRITKTDQTADVQADLSLRWAYTLQKHAYSNI